VSFTEVFVAFVILIGLLFLYFSGCVNADENRMRKGHQLGHMQLVSWLTLFKAEISQLEPSVTNESATSKCERKLYPIPQRIVCQSEQA
jgi:hypothetical protein